MGSVFDYIDCPRCGEPNCHSDYYYNSGEEYIQCPDCGYYKSVEIKGDSRNKKLSDLTEDDWEISEFKNPYGAFRAKSKKSTAWIGGSISTKSHLKDIIKNLTDDIDEFTVSRVINGKVVIVDMLRKLKLEKLKKGINS